MADPSPPGRSGNHRRRGRGGKPPAPAPPSRHLAAITAPSRVDLERPVSEEFTPDEQREVAQHLAFLRTHKAILGLSLNATEDLLVNGVRPPTDRGVVKHLLSKVDRKLVERVLAREAVQRDAALRARLLGGLVRLEPDPTVLLQYLEALAHVADKREAASAFHLTVDRIDFGRATQTQMGLVLEVVARTFEGHDRVQALFGLLASPTFEAALDRSMDALSPALRAMFAPLQMAHRVVLRKGESPRDPASRALLDEGIATWLKAPDPVLRSYSAAVRERLARVAVDDVALATSSRAARVLVESLPHASPTFATLAVELVDRLLAASQDDAARSTLQAVLAAQPSCQGALRRREALGWARVGRLALMPPAQGQKPPRLARAFWLDRAAFVLARVGRRDDAARFASEAELQQRLVLPGVATCLGAGVAPDGRPYVVLEGGARPFEPSSLARAPLGDRLAIAAQGARILHAVAAAGLALPDFDAARLTLDRNAPHGLRLADLDGVVARAPAEAHAAHARLARAWLDVALGPHRASLPRLGGDELAALVVELALRAARAID